MNQEIKEKFKNLVGITDGVVLFDEPMKNHTTFKTGGPCEVFYAPTSIDGITKALAFVKENNVPYYIVGNGSNLLVSDKGFDGVIICLLKNYSEITLDGNKIYAQAGAMLSSVASLAKKESLTGLEFASGIPGSLGGAVIMNAGAYGGEMAQVIEKVTLLDNDGNVMTIKGSDMEFGYRTSLAAKKNYIVLSAVIALKKGESEEIRSRMEELANARKTKQPLEFPSAGSTFKRPEGYFAGKLIQDSGLAGYRSGGACVSEKHCGFVVNDQAGNSEDVMAVINHVRETVKEKFDVTLEMEIKTLGEF